MKKSIIFLLLICLCISVKADVLTGKSSLSGVVTDEIDGSTLVGVSIYFPELKTGTTTDEDGKYSIQHLPTKKLVVQVSYLGHQTIIKTISLTKTNILDFVMKESNAMIDEVVVTGVTGNSLLKNSPSPVSVVSPTELLAQSSTNIIDAIAKQPGISQITTGSGISKPVIRGLGYNRVVVVDDNIRQEGQQWGDEHGVEIDPQTVHSVEILKGPASLRYGSDAMAGVIIFHEAPSPSAGEIKASLSSEYQTNNGLFDYSLNLAGNNKGIVWGLRYSDKMAHAYKNKYDGYVYNSGFRERGANGLIGLNKNWGYSHLKLSYYQLTPGIVEGERDEETGEFIKPINDNGKEGEAIATHSDFKSYSHQMPYQQVKHYKAVLDNSFIVGDGNLSALIGYQQNRRQEFEDVINPSTCGLDFKLHTVNYDVHYLFPEMDDWKISAGVNGMYQRSENKGNEFLIPSYNLFDYGVFATAARSFGKFSVSGGLRWDNRHQHGNRLDDEGEVRFESFTRNFNGFTGSAGLVYNATDNLNVRLNLSRGFRAPNISELASNGIHEGTIRYEKGNAQLKPENSWQLDAGVDYSSSIISAQLSLFANFIDNYIFSHKLTDANGETVITEGQPTYQFIAGNSRIMGGEVSIDIHPIEKLHYQNTFSYVNAIQLHQPEQTKYLPFTPAPRWLSDIKYDIIRDGKVFNNTFVSIGLDCNLRQNHYYKENDTETATPSYTLLNFSAGTDIKSKGKKLLSVYFMANNITDKAYQSHLSRLKYAAVNNTTGRQGVYNMGRNFSLKILLPINL